MKHIGIAQRGWRELHNNSCLTRIKFIRRIKPTRRRLTSYAHAPGIELPDLRTYGRLAVGRLPAKRLAVASEVIIEIEAAKKAARIIQAGHRPALRHEAPHRFVKR